MSDCCDATGLSRSRNVSLWGSQTMPPARANRGGRVEGMGQRWNRCWYTPGRTSSARNAACAAGSLSRSAHQARTSLDQCLDLVYFQFAAGEIDPPQPLDN